MIKNLCWELLNHDVIGHRTLSQDAEPAQSGRSQDHRINLALSYPLDSGPDISSNRYHV